MADKNVFHLNTPEVNARRGAAKERMDKVNNVIWDSQDERTEYVRGVFGAVGENPTFSTRCTSPQGATCSSATTCSSMAT